jgi:hypothetical protein
MALKFKLTKAEFDALADALKEHYKAIGEDYILQGEGIEDVTGLKSAFEKEKKERKRLAGEAEKYKDLDPEKARAALLKLQELDDKELVDKGEYDRVLAKKEKEWKDERVTLEQQITERNARLDRFELINPVRDAALKAGVLADDIDIVLSHTSPRFKLNDKRKVVVLDKDGDPTELTLDKYFGEVYKQEHPKFYQATNAGGSGATQTNGGKNGGRVITVDEQQKMTAQESTQFFKDGGKIAA